MNSKGIMFIGLSLLLFSILGCKSEDTYQQFIFKNLRQYPDFNVELFDSIFIIPRLGCNSCTKQADQIIKNKFNNLDNLFIFTNIQSKNY